jgi:hypothetical protein
LIGVFSLLTQAVTMPLAVLATLTQSGLSVCHSCRGNTDMRDEKALSPEDNLAIRRLVRVFVRQARPNGSGK